MGESENAWVVVCLACSAYWEVIGQMRADCGTKAKAPG